MAAKGRFVVAVCSGSQCTMCGPARYIAQRVVHRVASPVNFVQVDLGPPLTDEERDPQHVPHQPALQGEGEHKLGFLQWRRDFRDSVPVIAIFDRDTDKVASLDEMMIVPGQQPHSILFSPTAGLRGSDGMPITSPAEDDLVQEINSIIDGGGDEKGNA